MTNYHFKVKLKRSNPRTWAQKWSTTRRLKSHRKRWPQMHTHTAENKLTWTHPRWLRIVLLEQPWQRRRRILFQRRASPKIRVWLLIQILIDWSPKLNIHARSLLRAYLKKSHFEYDDLCAEPKTVEWRLLDLIQFMHEGRFERSFSVFSKPQLAQRAEFEQVFTSCQITGTFNICK